MLKQLKLRAELAQKETERAALESQEAGFQKREQELAASLEEAASEEDFKLLEEEITALEEERKAAGTEEKRAALQTEISRIKKDLEDLEQRSKEAKGAPAASQAGGKTEQEERAMNVMQTRDLLRTGEYYQRQEVRDFYDQFRNLRAVGGADLLIPHTVVNRILDIVGDYSTLYPLVEKMRAGGTTRILMDTDTTAATWIEQNGGIPAGDVGTVTSIDFDGYKIGKVTFVDNCALQDSIVNLDDYVTKKIARAISLGLDLAILKGKGAAQKQPEGILTKLPSSHKVTVTNPAGYADIVKPIGLIDTGLDSVGGITAVMKRSTYYNRLMAYSIQVNSSGTAVAKLPNLNSPDFLGLPVVFNNNMDEDAILFGDFSKYMLVERESVSIDNSPHVKYAEDQMAFRGKGRFDGKPVKPDAFVFVSLSYPAPASK